LGTAGNRVAVPALHRRWLAAAFPIALSIAVFESWTQPLLTIGLFVAAELVVNNVVEPWLYGATTEISPLTVIVSALFWTWLWGGVGLVLATPLTVCLAVAGKYLPDLAFLDLLMGDKPSIAPGDRLYQRLLALNEEEASDIIERHAREESMLSAFDEAVLPALRNIEADFRAGVLSDVARTDACQILRQIIADLGEPHAASDATTAPILCIPASHEGDELGALMLAQVLAESGIASNVLSSKLLAAESLEQAVDRAVHRLHLLAAAGFHHRRPRPLQTFARAVALGKNPRRTVAAGGCRIHRAP
jgi:hypothetical protein